MSGTAGKASGANGAAICQNSRMNRIGTLLGGIAFAFGLTALYYAWVGWNAQRDFAARAVHIEAVISDLRQVGDNPAAPVVQYTAPDGSIVHFSVPTADAKPAYARGDKVKVVVDPLRPQQARVENSAWPWWAEPAALGAAGLGLALFGGNLLRQYRRALQRDVGPRR
jgi:hypothetical protein